MIKRNIFAAGRLNFLLELEAGDTDDDEAIFADDEEDVAFADEEEETFEELLLVMPDGACPELVERVPASPFLEEELCVSLDPSLELRMTKK